MIQSARCLAFSLLPIFAIGCADATEESTESGEGAATVAASLDANVKAAVGAVVVNGQRLCTAALVDVDAAAEIKVGGKSEKATGRQIVFGGACVGKLKSGLTGAAAFVTQKNGLSLSTPILSFDFETQASAGLAVGILGAKPEATPLKLHGIAASAHAGVKTAALLHASDENGLLVAASASAEAGFDVALQTQCTSIQFGAEVGVSAGAKVQLKGGEDALALVQVNGKLQVAAYLDIDIDGGCIVEKVEKVVTTIAKGTIEAANEVGDTLSSFGTANVVGVYGQTTKEAEFKVYLNQPAKVLRVNSQGFIRARANKVGCGRIPLLALSASCEIAPENGFQKGWVTVKVDLGANLFPDPAGGQRVFLSTADEAKFPETHTD